jgi:SAM-dependent methyltransferase
MSEDPVREIHDAVARSPDHVQASVRPPGTTPRQLRAMTREVLRKLEVGPRTSVLEIGCGIGVLGLPVARTAASYVGLDFAPRAVEVFQARLTQAGLSGRARALCLDVLTASDAELRALGRYDRVLMYAVVHYARSDAEAHRFLEHTVALLAPGGRALIGNVPLEDLDVDWAPDVPASRTVPGRVVSWVRWAMAPPARSPVQLTRRWKMRRGLELALSSGRPDTARFTPAQLPPSYTVALTVSGIERSLADLGVTLRHRWSPPGPGVPLAAGRADLIIERPH